MVVAAAEEKPVLNKRLVRLSLLANVVSDCATIEAAVVTASVPLASSGAENSIAPMTSFTPTVVSEVCNLI